MNETCVIRKKRLFKPILKLEMIKQMKCFVLVWKDRMCLLALCFRSRSKKNVYPCKPQLNYKKRGLTGACI